MKKENDPEVGIRDSTSELYMLNKKERRLTKEVLLMAIGTEGGRKFVMERFGKEGLRIAASLLQGMGVEVGKTRRGSQKVFDD
jgi:hypothetical protein